MKEKTETFNQGKRYFFYILMFAILGWFIFMQIFGADERSSDTSAASVIYSGTVTWQKPDGTTQEISVPGTYKVPVGDTMVLTIQLPDDRSYRYLLCHPFFLAGCGFLCRGQPQDQLLHA